MDFGALFDTGLSYAQFLQKFGTDDHRRRWQAMHDAIALTDSQKALLRSFRREMKVVVLAGAWCGDCVNQCPIFARFAEETDAIRLAFFDRDASPELAKELSICGAPRVPAVLFLSEDNFPCGRAGDRTLSKYRQLAANLSGAACSTGIALPGDSAQQRVVQEWLDEFEKVQLMLRTSSRLRQKHGD